MKTMSELLRRLYRARVIARLRRQEAQMRDLAEQSERAIDDARAILDYALRRQREIEGELFWAEHGRVKHAGRGRVIPLAVAAKGGA